MLTLSQDKTILVLMFFYFSLGQEIFSNFYLR